jgi:GTP-binding protein YchF
MGLKCGIVGLPNVGKSTLFNALSSAKAQSANFPFCTIEPNLGTITVPDERLNRLSDLVNPQRVIPTTIEIVDIAGLVKGASKGEGLGNQFLANIREVDAIVHVVRCFDDPNVIHVDGSVDPVRDKEIIDTELQLKDLDSLEKRLDRYERKAKAGEKDAVRQVEFIRGMKAHVERGLSARSYPTSEEFVPLVKELQLLTTKPVIYVCNVEEGAVLTGNAHTERLRTAVADENAEVVLISAAIEADIAELATYEERMEFIRDMGLDEPGVNKVIRACYRLLNLITYFTAGVQEVRAWTIQKGTLAPQAAGVIHTDFERGFIRAEVIGYDNYLHYKSEQAVKEAGKMGVEGKEYVVKDGDIMHFRFNV